VWRCVQEDLVRGELTCSRREKGLKNHTCPDGAFFQIECKVGLRGPEARGKVDE
jgi:hypothetical protein